ncbi:transmembrane protein 192 [Plakobranchus ocellatus]|uniref:Transmembrane protein 192 n=1 Tax=Plakobranchus ocellatus TaxID=259542 RepID=A0AAV4CQY9_9GAST|nr:transmembrane protein 192 [Plakobranchus ocellatus]
MVSLGDTRNSRGYFGFSEEHAVINSGDEELIVDHIELVADPEMKHKPIRTTWAILFIKLIYIVLGVSAYVVPTLCSIKRCVLDPLSLTLYIHGGMWFVLFLMNRLLVVKHNESRLNGYLDFYRRTRSIRAVPFEINSCANALMVILIKLLDHFCYDDGKCDVLSKMRFVQILVSVECVLALIVLCVYFVRTVKFNRRKALPDVTQDELLTSFVNSHSSADIGSRNENYIDQVMEKQADMIRYLRQHSEALARRNLALTEEMGRIRGLRRDNVLHGHI